MLIEQKQSATLTVGAKMSLGPAADQAQILFDTSSFCIPERQ